MENLDWRKTASALESDRDATLQIFLDLGEGDEVPFATIRAGEINAFGLRPVPDAPRVEATCHKKRSLTIPIWRDRSPRQKRQIRAFLQRVRMDDRSPISLMAPRLQTSR